MTVQEKLEFRRVDPKHPFFKGLQEIYSKDNFQLTKDENDYFNSKTLEFFSGNYLVRDFISMTGLYDRGMVQMIDIDHELKEMYPSLGTTQLSALRRWVDDYINRLDYLNLVAERFESDNPNFVPYMLNGDLHLTIEFPDHLTDIEVESLVRETILKIDNLHRSSGGKGLKVERAVFTRDKVSALTGFETWVE